MGRDPRNTSRYRVPLEQLPNDLLTEADPLHPTGAVHGPEYETVSDAGGGRPGIHCYLHPRRHRYRPHTAVLSHQVHDAPTPVALLDVRDGERCHFRPPQPAAQEDRQDRTVTEALPYAGIRSVQQRLRLPDRKPVSQADTFGGDTLHSRNPIGQLRCQEPVVRGFNRQFPDRRDPHVDGNSAESAQLQGNAPSAHRRLGESRPGFQAIPLEEFVEPQVVHATGDRGGDAVEHQTLQSLPMGRLRNNSQISHLGPLNGQYREQCGHYLGAAETSSETSDGSGAPSSSARSLVRQGAGHLSVLVLSRGLVAESAPGRSPEIELVISRQRSLACFPTRPRL